MPCLHCVGEVSDFLWATFMDHVNSWSWLVQMVSSSSLAIANQPQSHIIKKDYITTEGVGMLIYGTHLISFFSALPDAWALKELLDHGEVIEISRLNSNAYQISEINFLNNYVTLRRPCLMMQRFENRSMKQELTLLSVDVGYDSLIQRVICMKVLPQKLHLKTKDERVVTYFQVWETSQWNWKEASIAIC